MRDSGTNDIRKGNFGEYTRYLEQRRVLDGAEFKIAESLDKALLTLSGGALAVSMTFVKDIAKNPKWTWALISAWILFGFTVMVLLVSLYVCQLAYKKEREILDEEENKRLKKYSDESKGQDKAVKKRNIWSLITKIGNLMAMLLFLIGLVFLGIFIWVNM